MEEKQYVFFSSDLLFAAHALALAASEIKVMVGLVASQFKHYSQKFAQLQDVPVAKANPADIQDLLGGALFKALYKWMQESGPVYLLPTGMICKESAVQRVIKMLASILDHCFKQLEVLQTKEAATAI